MLFLNRLQLLFPTSDILSPFPPSYKSCESRPVWGARTFSALWHFDEGLFILYFFQEKEGLLINQAD